MVSVKVKKGEFSNLDEYSLYLDNGLVFTGYDYELISTDSGYVELKMNSIVDDDVIIFKVTRYKDLAILIPNNYFKFPKKISTLFLNLNELKKIWEYFGFDFNDDENMIFNTTAEDIKDCWLNTLIFKIKFYNKNDLIEYLSQKILAINCSKIELAELVKLLKDNWIDKNKKFVISSMSVIKNPCVAYVDSEEWEFATELNEKDKLFFRIGQKYYAEIV